MVERDLAGAYSEAYARKLGIAPPNPKPAITPQDDQARKAPTEHATQRRQTEESYGCAHEFAPAMAIRQSSEDGGAQRGTEKGRTEHRTEFTGGHPPLLAHGGGHEGHRLGVEAVQHRYDETQTEYPQLQGSDRCSIDHVGDVNPFHAQYAPLSQHAGEEDVDHCVGMKLTDFATVHIDAIGLQ